MNDKHRDMYGVEREWCSHCEGSGSNEYGYDCGACYASGVVQDTPTGDL